MTNEQLAILLRGVYDRFEEAIAETRATIADTRPLVVVRRHVAAHAPFAMLIASCEDPEHYADLSLPDPVVELAALDSALKALDESITVLRG